MSRAMIHPLQTSAENNIDDINDPSSEKEIMEGTHRSLIEMKKLVFLKEIEL